MTYDFDTWRHSYDSMSYEDHRKAYSELWDLYPVQQHFDAAACSEFLDRARPVNVLEVGGWNGELASLVLPTHPSIEGWLNAEICDEAVDATVCFDHRYHAVVPDKFIWEIVAPTDYDTLVMSHSAEHMRWDQLRALFAAVKPSAVYLAMPLPEDGDNPDWKGYDGTHILEVGWNTINEVLGDAGLRRCLPRTSEVRCWAA